MPGRTVTSITPRRRRRSDAPTPATPRRARRPFRDNPRLILAGIGVLRRRPGRASSRSPTGTPRLSPDFLTEFVLYALSAADLTMLAALVFVLARNIIKLVVERRRGAAVRALPRQAGRAAARHDARAGGARADRRQRADSHQHRSLVQRADGRDPVVGQPDRERLLPRAADAGRAITPSRLARALAAVDLTSADVRPMRDLLAPDVTLQRVQMVEVYRVVPAGADRCRALEPVVDVAAPALPPGYSRAAADRLAAQALGGSAETPVDRDARRRRRPAARRGRHPRRRTARRPASSSRPTI